MATLNAHVYVANKEGVKELLTIRDVIAKGRGKAYDALKAMGSWESNIAEFKAEQKDPLGAAKNAVRLATKKYEKAQWWLDVGLYRMAREAARKATREEEMEAIDELRAADIQLTNRVQDENAIIEKVKKEEMESEWDEFITSALDDSADSGVQLARVGKLGASLPIYPWADCHQERSFTSNFFSTCVSYGSVPVSYPVGTKLVVSYTSQADTLIHTRTAFIDPEGRAVQVAPEHLTFDNIGKFIDYTPKMHRAKVTVSLPESLSKMQLRAAQMEKWLQDDGQKGLTVARKISMIYAEFGLMSRVQNDISPIGNGVWSEYGGNRIGSFLRFPNRELEIESANDGWKPVAAHNDKVYYRSLLVDDLRLYVKDGILTFRLSWNSGQGRNSVMISF